MDRRQTCGIYKITNQVNGKVYIGQSTRVEERWKEHKRKPFLESSEEYNYPLYQAIRKYGLENFTFEILEECPQEELNQKEEYYISLYESYPPDKGKGYNQTKGGENNTAQKLSPSQLQEIIKMLIQGEFLKDIASKFSICLQTVSDINNGRAHFNPNYSYPIRIKEKSFVLPTCICCGAQLKYYKSKYCRKCALKVPSPEKEQLLKDIYELGTDIKLGEKYKVSTAIISKWKDQFNIPRKRKEAVQEYEKDYLHIERKPKLDNSPKSILKINAVNEIVEEFSSAAEAGRAMGTTGWTIIQQCQKYPKLYKNYYWKFKNSE